MRLWWNELYERDIDAHGGEFGVQKNNKAVFVAFISINTKL